MNTLIQWTRRSIAIVIFAAVASLSPALHAQYPQTVAQFSVPFAFDYASRHFAPGTYTLQAVNPYVIIVHGNSGSALSMMQEASAGSQTRSRIVFLKSGNHYDLQEIWLAGGGNYIYARRSIPSKHAELASNSLVTSQVEIALLDRPSSGSR